MAGSKGSKYYDIFLKYSLWLCTNEEKGIIDENIINLLKSIKKTGSLKSAADEIKISYRKAWGNIKDSENHLNFKLVEKQRGGKDGGHSTLTQDAETLINAFNELNAEFNTAINKITKKFFNKINN
ncbi:MAG: LysR family transcriptional regulator [Bacteroidales bacterium]|nr:LysR family transcriptional regulator [Bacteroidales bacterium]MBN2757413.1 LysR family transcriptional regulator [Bacteroidales bacterium]